MFSQYQMLCTLVCLRVLGYTATLPGTFAHGVGSSYRVSLSGHRVDD